MATSSLLQMITNELYQGKLPRVDMHVHTSWTDGEDTVRAMYERACQADLEILLFSEHARRSSTDWFADFAADVRGCSGACRALVGVESRINDADGSLEVGSEILDQCDLVVASVHRLPDGKPSELATGPEILETELAFMLGALDNPRVDILGHPFGISMRFHSLFPSLEQLDELGKKAAARGVAIEINTKYNPDPWDWINRLSRHGTLLSFGADAHSVDELGGNLVQAGGGR